MIGRHDLAVGALLSVLWWLPTLWIGTAGEFPISDDWAYAHTVEVLLETGRFERPAWTWAPSMTNVAVGTAFTAVLGFSHAALRLSTLALGWLGILATFGLVRQVGGDARMAGLAGATLAVNPMFVNLGLTFMTDVGFVTFTTASLWAMAAALSTPGGRGSLTSWGLAGILAAAALLSRQPAMVLPVAAGCALLILHRRRPLVWAGVAGAGLLGLGLYSALPYFYGSGDGGRHMRLLWYLENQVLSASAFYHVARALLTTASVLGLCLLPWLGALTLRRRSLALGATLTALLLAVAWRLDIAAPFHLNLLRADLGLGPMTLPGGLVATPWSEPLWWLLDGLGCLVSGTLLAELFARRETLYGRPELWALLAFPALCLGVLAFQSPFFDRWLLPFVGPLAAVLAVTMRAATPGPARRAATLLPLALLGLWSWLGTADGLDHHRARWELLAALRTEGVSPARIDGGFEFNGLYNFAKDDRDWERFKKKPGSLWVVDDEYVVTLARDLPGYERVDQREVTRRLPPGPEPIFVYRRLPAR